MLLWCLVLGAWPFQVTSQANPVGPVVTQGSASFTSQGSKFTIRTSDRAYINWQSFNIGLGETTAFLQPSSSSLVWNRINDPNASQILGNLNANGYVVLQNQSGFYIGGQASISAHGLLMTTVPVPAPDLSSGGAWQFNAPPPAASIINYGAIQASRGGSIFLIGEHIENHGTISAPGGDIDLCAGKQVMISDRPDGRGLSAQVTLPEGSVDNSGKLLADAGTIAVHAQVVNQGGLVQANSVRQVNGTIELVAGDALNLGTDSKIDARGDAQGTSSGGSVLLKSGGSFSDQASSVIDISGGARAGNGGEVEISAPQMSAIRSSIEGGAAHGFVGGKLLIDPANILLAGSGDAAPGSGIVNPGDPPSAGSPDTLTLDLNSFSSSLSQINLQATENIEISAPWTLANRGSAATLTLQAGNNITLDDLCPIIVGRNWSVNMIAGTKLTSAADKQSGKDGIYLLGNSYIQTQNGDINLWAGNEVIVNPGYGVLNSGAAGNNGIRTEAGGNIKVTALYGDVNAGGNSQGFTSFRSRLPYYRVSPTLGGISTAAGGNVEIDAGGDITSYLPLGNDGSSDAGSGAFGTQPGNVTISAGGSVFGHYVLANGLGSITAGVNAGGPDASENIALSLIKGNWSVKAPSGNIYLQEVRNPNGVYNNASGLSSPAYHYFDYDYFDYSQPAVKLTAGQDIHITGLSLPRPNDPVPMIFPSSLYMTAGGDIVLQDTVILFPSPYGDLNVSAGKNFLTQPNNLQQNGAAELIMSDAENPALGPTDPWQPKTHWLNSGDFGDLDHGPMPISFVSPDPVRINVAGNMENVVLATTRETEITVQGDMNNCSFAGQNLHPYLGPPDMNPHLWGVTSIDVMGRIFNRSPYTFVILSQGIQNLPAADTAPNSHPSWLSYFSAALDPAILATLQVPANLDPTQWAGYASRLASLFPSGNPGFVYNADTKRLGFSGTMSEAVRAALEQPLTVLRYGLDGLPILDANRHFVTDKVTFTAASAIDCPTPNLSAIECLYQQSLGAPSVSDPAGLGYRVGGPGQFNVTASSISLGNSYGILSCGVGDPTGNRYANLASLTKQGATLNVSIAGDLDMITSTIAALGGGDVNVNSVSGSLNLGSQELFSVPRGLALGIYTSGHGDVNVSALGNIDISGSRIAAYNGGNIHVESFQGNVDCGDGGTAYVTIPSYFVDPRTGLAAFNGEQVFGSGILATTLVDPSKVPGSPTVPGNIEVETPRGDILASRGGILQDALNGNLAPGPMITLHAGSDGYHGNIDLGDSGVIGGTINLEANGNINGLIISRQNTTVNAAQSFSGTVLSGGSANLSAGGTISGIVIGVGGVQASGGQGITASLLGQSVSVGGGQAQSTLGTTAAATSTSQAAAQTASSDAKQQVGSDTSNDDDEKKKKANHPMLTRRVGRVTVILPNRI